MGGNDLYLEEILAELGGRGFDDPHRQLHEFTAVVLRPECVVRRRCRLALDLLRAEGFEPLAGAVFIFNRNMVRELWRWTPGLRPTPEFCELIDLYCDSGESLYVLLRDTTGGDLPASERLLAYKGPSRVDDRQAHQLRARLDDLLLRPLSFVHGPENTREFLRELGVFLSTSKRRHILDALARGQPAGVRVEEAITGLYARVPQLDLRPAEVAAQVRAAIMRRPPATVSPAWPEQLVRGERSDWRELLAALDGGDEPIPLWSRIVLAAGAVDSDLPSAAPSCGPEPARGPR